MLQEVLDNLRDELFLAMKYGEHDNVARLERAIYIVEGQMALEEERKDAQS